LHDDVFSGADLPKIGTSPHDRTPQFVYPMSIGVLKPLGVLVIYWEMRKRGWVRSLKWIFSCEISRGEE
jgi:hypothetical protein